MPKIAKRKTRVVKRVVRHRRVKLSAGKIKKNVILIVGIAVIVVLVLGLVLLQPWKFVEQKITSLTQGTPITMPKPEKDFTKNISIEPDKAKTVFLKTEKGAVISLLFPVGAVSQTRKVSIATTKDETGVIILPEGTKFLRPVSITFDLSKTSLMSDAPEKVDPDNPRITGKTHIYNVDSKGNVSPVLIARGMESSVIVSGRTLFSGAYILRTDDKSAEKYANATLDNSDSYFFSTLEAAATLLGNNKSLSEKQQANAKKAVTKVIEKKAAPLFELYAAIVVNKQLEGKDLSFVPLAYAEDKAKELEDNLKKTCSEENHSIETFINAEILAKFSHFDSVAALCRATGSKVLREQAQALFNNPHATFEEVMVMIGYVKSIEGTNSTLLFNMETKLKQVVDRDFREAINDRTVNIEELQEVWERKEFTEVDPALSKELDRVTFIEARESIEKILAKDCPLPSEVVYAKSLVIQYKLDDLKSKVANKNQCKIGGGSAPGDGNPPPPPPGGGNGGGAGNTSMPVVVGTCFDPFSWGFNINDDISMCEVCYDALTDDARLDYIETKCVQYECSDNSVNEKLDRHKCKLYKDAEEAFSKEHPGGYTDDKWKPLDDDMLPLPPMPDSGGSDNGGNENPGGPDGPEIPDSMEGSSGGTDSSENPGGPDGPELPEP